MKIFDSEADAIINGIVALGAVTYDEALKLLVPLIDRTEFQRKLQDKKFYQKLERDLEGGCVMPAITVAFITSEVTAASSMAEMKAYIEGNISKSFVLDGIQRLNTLSRLSDSEKLSRAKKLYVNFIFCDSADKLLYRMITLNNGQRPMTPRHQVEVMMTNVYDFDEIGIKVQTEKDGGGKGSRSSFRKADLIQAYLAFMANSPVVDNKKIIQEKMDDLLVNKIISNDPLEKVEQFEQFLKAIHKFQDDPVVFKWLKITNNLVGFAAGFRKSKVKIIDFSVDEFRNAIETFDQAFSDFSPSRIKVGKYRRDLSCEFFANFGEFSEYDSDDLLDYFSDITSDD